MPPRHLPSHEYSNSNQFSFNMSQGEVHDEWLNASRIWMSLSNLSLNNETSNQLSNLSKETNSNHHTRNWFAETQNYYPKLDNFSSVKNCNKSSVSCHRLIAAASVPQEPLIPISTFQNYMPNDNFDPSARNYYNNGLSSTIPQNPLNNNLGVGLSPLRYTPSVNYSKPSTPRSIAPLNYSNSVTTSRNDIMSDAQSRISPQKSRSSTVGEIFSKNDRNEISGDQKSVSKRGSTHTGNIRRSAFSCKRHERKMQSFIDWKSNKTYRERQKKEVQIEQEKANVPEFREAFRLDDQDYNPITDNRSLRVRKVHQECENNWIGYLERHPNRIRKSLASQDLRSISSRKSHLDTVEPLTPESSTRRQSLSESFSKFDSLQNLSLPRSMRYSNSEIGERSDIGDYSENPSFMAAASMAPEQPVRILPNGPLYNPYWNMRVSRCTDGDVYGPFATINNIPRQQSFQLNNYSNYPRANNRNTNYPTMMQGVNSEPLMRGVNSVPMMQGVNSVPMMQGVNSVPMMQGVNSVPMMQGMKPEAMMQGMIPEAMMQGMIPEAMMRGMKPEAMMRGMKPEAMMQTQSAPQSELYQTRESLQRARIELIKQRTKAAQREKEILEQNEVAIKQIKERAKIRLEETKKIIIEKAKEALAKKQRELSRSPVARSGKLRGVLKNTKDSNTISEREENKTKNLSSPINSTASSPLSTRKKNLHVPDGSTSRFNNRLRNEKEIKNTKEVKTKKNSDVETEEKNIKYVHDENEAKKIKFVQNEKQPKIIKFVEDEKEAKNIKNAQNEKEAKNIKYAQNEKEAKNIKYVQNEKEDENIKYVRDEKEDENIKYVRDEKEAKNIKNAQNEKEAENKKYVRDEKEAKNIKNAQNEKEAKNIKYVRDEKEAKNIKNVRDEKETDNIEYVPDKKENKNREYDENKKKASNMKYLQHETETRNLKSLRTEIEQANMNYVQDEREAKDYKYDESETEDKSINNMNDKMMLSTDGYPTKTISPRVSTTSMYNDSNMSFAVTKDPASYAQAIKPVINTFEMESANPLPPRVQNQTTVLGNQGEYSKPDKNFELSYNESLNQMENGFSKTPLIPGSQLTRVQVTSTKTHEIEGNVEEGSKSICSEERAMHRNIEEYYKLKAMLHERILQDAQGQKELLQKRLDELQSNQLKQALTNQFVAQELYRREQYELHRKQATLVDESIECPSFDTTTDLSSQNCFNVHLGGNESVEPVINITEETFTSKGDISQQVLLWQNQPRQVLPTEIPRQRRPIFVPLVCAEGPVFGRNRSISPRRSDH